MMKTTLVITLATTMVGAAVACDGDKMFNNLKKLQDQRAEQYRLGYVTGNKGKVSNLRIGGAIQADDSASYSYAIDFKSKEPMDTSTEIVKFKVLPDCSLKEVDTIHVFPRR